jgi:S1-C subfamily serine protease
MYAWSWSLPRAALFCLSWILLVPSLEADTHSAAAPDGLAWYEAARTASLEVLVNGHMEGSAWLSPRKGCAITAAHVVSASGKRIEVLTNQGQRHRATVAAVDFGHDLAILQVPDVAGKGLPFASRVPRAGAEVFLLGSPLYRHRLLLRGNMASTDEIFEWNASLGGYMQVFSITASSPPGVSGGPWLDRDGRVIGVQSSMMSLNQAPLGIAFVAGYPAIAQLLADLRTPSTPTLGAAGEEFWEQEDMFRGKFPEKTAGVVLWQVAPKGPCAQAGLKDGDVVLKFDGRPVSLRDDLHRLVRSRSAGDTAVVSYLRPGANAPQQVNVRLGAMEADWASHHAPESRRTPTRNRSP